MSGRRSRPAVYSIAPGLGFVDALAAGVRAETGDDPLALARVTILLPTRRACRALQEAFLRLSDGRPLLLPRLLPLGDVDDDDLALAADAADIDLPPAIPPLRRQLMLARLIHARDAALEIDQAAQLAGELARLLDQVQTERLSFDRLRDLAPATYAEHWQVTLRFLEIVTQAWPRVLDEAGCLDPAARRNALLEARAAAWRRAPPADPVIAAGSTGSIPAAAELIEVVARLPRGRVVLPGLDRDADAATWAEIAGDPTHPQHGLALLLARLGLTPAEVEPWPDHGLVATNPSRARLVAEALRPAATTEAWREFAAAADRERLALALRDLVRVDCPGPQEEAGVIALLLREALVRPGKRAALVTPDRALARRVAAELRRWDIEIDDSAGRPLADTPPGTFLRLTAELFAERVAPLALLAAFKHPLAAGGRDPAAFRVLTRRLERRALRGPRPASGFAGLLAALGEAAGQGGLRTWLVSLADLARPFAELFDAPRAPLAALLDAHVAFAEALAASDAEAGAARLWAGEAGEAAAGFVAELRAAADGATPLPGARYPALLAALLAGVAVRPRYGAHPRLAIWGPLEARLQHADLLILGGLNEGTWPPEPAADPWLSRPMRREFGLPAPERRIGLSAHDFAQGCAAPEVVLTRALRVEGTPTVPSRWLLRLDALLSTLKLPLDGLRPGTWLGWQAALDRPDRYAPVAAPAPCPPVAARPRGLSVTRVETWMRDPYAIYARAVLKLKPLEPIDADPGAAERGTIVHRALDRFLRDHPDTLPADALDRLLATGRAAFGAALSRPAVWAFWWPRFVRIARWFVDTERARRGGLAASRTEAAGSLTVPGPGGPFVLTATADRIDIGADGRLTIIDYKTGAVPRPRDVELGFAPQLPLEAAIAAAGGFAGVPAATVAELAYWRLSGGEPPAEIKPVAGDAMALGAAALAGLERLIAAFDDPATPYAAVPRPDFAPRFGDYAHLARVKEWSAGAGPDGE